MSTYPRHLRAIDKQILIEFYKAQWKDIFDMNSLDWRVALIFIPLIGAFSAVVGILSQWMPPDIENYTQSIQGFALIAFLLCLYGLWTVAKGQAHSMLKFKTLKWVEKRLDLYRYTYDRIPERWWSVFLSRRVVLYVVYSILGWLSLTMTFIPIDEWGIYLPKHLRWFSALFGALAIAIIFLVIHWTDYKLHRKANETCETT